MAADGAPLSQLILAPKPNLGITVRSHQKLKAALDAASCVGAVAKPASLLLI